MSTTAEKTTTGENLLTSLDLEQNRLEGNDFIRSLRKAGLDSFARQGLPHRKNEEYKYSPVTALFKTELKLDTSASHTLPRKQEIESVQIPGLDSYLITLINGTLSELFSPCLSATPGFSVSNLKSGYDANAGLLEKHLGQYADVNTDAFTALNTAAFTDVLFIRIPDKCMLDKPIQILNIISADTPGLINPRILVHVGKQASVQIIEKYVSLGNSESSVNNSLTEIVVGVEAKTLFYKIQDDCAHLNLISTTQVVQAAGSHFDTHTVTLSGKWIRNNLNIVPDAEHCETHLNGLFLLNGTQHVDNHTLVDHRKPNCESNQLYRGILDEKSTGVFNGKIYVRPDAQKTNAYQSSKNMLLSDDATMNTKPQLEIYADDVKCSHGSSTGQIDEEALFYLRARGIGPDSARALLMLAFAKDVVNTIRIDALRTEVEKLIEKRLTK
jgi:Fe-S cluster assembly protein SufD